MIPCQDGPNKEYAATALIPLWARPGEKSGGPPVLIP